MNLNLIDKIDELVQLGGKCHPELIEVIQNCIIDMEVKENVEGVSKDREISIVFNHIEAYCRYGDAKEIEKAKIVINKISKF